MNVKMTQAWGWLVAGVLAAGLNASYHDGGLQWAHQIADQFSYQVEHRSAAVLDLATGHADRFLSEARLLTARQETPSCPWTTAMARVQTRVARSQAEFDRFEAVSDRQKAELERFEANRARVEAQMARIRSQIDVRTANLRLARTNITTASLAPLDLRILSAPATCSRIRVSVPRLPRIKVPAPTIEIESGSGPI
jgi:hypothetical protein